ncbi:MAG: hypothetical protein ACRDRN_24050 [Sciscionella sp.]
MGPQAELQATIRDGWLITPYAGHDLAQVHIAVSGAEGWHPAYLDWSDGARVAKIRPVGHGRVWLRVDGEVTAVGYV